MAPFVETVNMVSAPAVARERNIEVSEVTCEMLEEFQTLIRVVVTTERQTRSVAGTLFAQNKPRLVEIRGIPIDAELGPNMLMIINEDKPGFIGALGTALGTEKINIATFHLGRDKPGGDAIAFIEVDQSIDEGMAAQIRALPQVMRCKPMRF